MGTSAERDLERAADLRKMAKGAASPKAKQDFAKAAERMERRAAKKASKLASTRKRTPSGASARARPIVDVR